MKTKYEFPQFMQITLTNIFQLVMAAQFSVYVIFMMRTMRLLPFSLLLFTISVHMITNFLIDTQTVASSYDITFSFRFVYGPLLYLSVREIIRQKPKLEYKDLVHAIPFLIAVPSANSYFIYDVLGIFSLAIYFALAIKLVISVKQKSADIVSVPGAGRIDWIQNATIGLVLISIFDICHVMIFKYDLLQSTIDFHQMTLIMLIVLMNWSAYKAIRYPEEFEGFTSVDLTQIQGTEDDSSILNDEEKAAIEDAITYLKEKKLYLKPTLRASDLADSKGLKPRFLSRALYLHTGMRFNSLVNTLRIDEAKKLISSTPSDELNILAISFEVGFNSKTVFNSSFKTMTGMTPSEYKKTQK
ncbi:AraC family transcriptional regulator [Alteromonas aestuariivivens]|uniref:AraC family transcriptional regulator n=1 Tax=Alteromonas aestuariivivens TaxID=1938339 RepID=A0A3D8M6J3_9ALTE|nr:response regulator transcription factor [Alteromonas aestuariivivens]RDV25175.1 AraC family transcriptional regulator [Alteromonas aestuariivivens]